MSKINFNKIISEEIRNFDFLNNESHIKEQESVELLQNEELQKQFICDLLLNRNEKIKIISTEDAILGGDWESKFADEINSLTINYGLNIEYKYDLSKEPISFKLSFNSDRIGVDARGEYSRETYSTPSVEDVWFTDIQWSDINVNLYDNDYTGIEFIAFKKAPPKIRDLFTREFVGEFIIDNTSMDIMDKPNKAIVSQYC